MIENATLHKPLKVLQEVAPQTFIFESKGALPTPLCEEMIEKFEAGQSEQYIGQIGQTNKMNRSIKRSTDIFISGKQHWQKLTGNCSNLWRLRCRNFANLSLISKGVKYIATTWVVFA